MINPSHHVDELRVAHQRQTKECKRLESNQQLRRWKKKSGSVPWSDQELSLT
jgi:hypothetical protein